jgi:RNA polymerase sigma-70 factor (ECF subfamily)
MVLGVGSAVMVPAIRLSVRTHRARVTLVSQSDVFVERVRLHQYAPRIGARREVSREQIRFKPSREDQERILHSFMRAVTRGDMAALKDVLSEDIVVWADGWGKVRGAATRPLYGRDAASTFLVSSRRFVPSEATTYEIAMRNAEPGVILRVDGRLLVSMSFEISDDRIAAMRLVANPDKLSGIDR